MTIKSVSSHFLTIALFLTHSVSAIAADTPEAQVAWRLLDYIAVDYSGAVANGKIISEGEYAEMKEFAETVNSKLTTLPDTEAKARLIVQAKMLNGSIAQKDDAAKVAAASHQLASELLAAYPTPLEPKSAPDLTWGKQLYATNCAMCHGAAGKGDGENAAVLNPPPIAFTDHDRARKRSAFGLYQVIGQGVEGTAMPSFDSLSPMDRWALAFFIGHYAYSDEEVAEGERLWKGEESLHTQIPDMKTFAQLTEEGLGKSVGEENARYIFAYLRTHPQALYANEKGQLTLAQERLKASEQAYLAGDHNKASELALSAYLDGFEPVEAVLKTRNADLLAQVEKEMAQLRSSIDRDAPAGDVSASMAKLLALMKTTEQAIAPSATSAGSVFAGTFTVLVREGLEALLIVVAIIAFLRKAERRDVLVYVHGGWLTALIAGGLTWWVATYAITISGASRELTEGFGGILAAAVLISVGIWMHGKSNADNWQKYIKKKLSHALSRRSAWFLFLLTFVVVYREAFETILFFVALWNQGNEAAFIGGLAAAIVTLALIAWAMLGYSKKLPITQFFAFSALLMAFLAVTLAGKGVSALQEAGMIQVTPNALPSVDLLGISPTWESIGTQFAVILILVVGFWWSRPLKSEGRI